MPWIDEAEPCTHPQRPEPTSGNVDRVWACPDCDGTWRVVLVGHGHDVMPGERQVTYEWRHTDVAPKFGLKGFGLSGRKPQYAPDLPPAGFQPGELWVAVAKDKPRPSIPSSWRVASHPYVQGSNGLCQQVMMRQKTRIGEEQYVDVEYICGRGVSDRVHLRAQG